MWSWIGHACPLTASCAFTTVVSESPRVSRARSSRHQTRCGWMLVTHVATSVETSKDKRRTQSDRPLRICHLLREKNVSSASAESTVRGQAPPCCLEVLGLRRFPALLVWRNLRGLGWGRQLGFPDTSSLDPQPGGDLALAPAVRLLCLWMCLWTCQVNARVFSVQFKKKMWWKHLKQPNGQQRVTLNTLVQLLLQSNDLQLRGVKLGEGGGQLHAQRAHLSTAIRLVTASDQQTDGGEEKYRGETHGSKVSRCAGRSCLSCRGLASTKRISKSVCDACALVTWHVKRACHETIALQVTNRRHSNMKLVVSVFESARLRRAQLPKGNPCGASRTLPELWSVNTSTARYEGCARYSPSFMRGAQKTGERKSWSRRSAGTTTLRNSEEVPFRTTVPLQSSSCILRGNTVKQRLAATHAKTLHPACTASTSPRNLTTKTFLVFGQPKFGSVCRIEPRSCQFVL